MTRGFTLLEILITISLLLMAFTAGLVAYQKAARNQALESDTAKIIQVLNTAKTNAKSGKKISCGSTPLEAWQVKFTANSYELKEICGTISTTPSMFKLTNGITITTLPSPDTIKFFPLSRGTDISNSTSIIIKPDSNSNVQKTITINSSGNIQ